MHSKPFLHLQNWTIRLAIVLSLAQLLFAQTGNQSNTGSLSTDEPIAFSIAGDEPRAHEVPLSSDEFFQVHVEQLDLDVILTLRDGSRNEVARMRMPRSYQGGLTLTFVAPTAGSYRLEVTASDANAARGKYTIRREGPRPATTQDRRRVDVEHTFAAGMTARDTAGQAETAIKKFTAARAGWQELADGRMADITNLLIVQSQARATFIEARKLVEGNSVEANREALTKFERASKLYEEGGELDKKPMALMGAALAASRLNSPRIVIDFLKQAFPLFSKPEDRPTKANLMLEIVKYSISVGDDNTALDHLRLVQPIYVDLGFQQEAAITTMTIGAYYYRFGDNRRAFEFLNAALPFRKILGDKCNEVELLANLGAASLALDRKADAMRLLNEEIPALIGSEAGCEPQKAVALNNLGKAYYNLGDYGLAISKYTEALGFSQDNSIKADTYFNLGAAYFESGRYDRARKSYRQASSLYRDASAQIKVDLDTLKSTQSQPPIQQLQSSLKSRQDIGDKSGEAKTLTRLSEVYLKLKNKPAALAASQQALTLYGALNDGSGEAIALGNAMKVWRSLGNKRLAIFFGKQSLNKFQELREAARGIEINVQKSYLRTFKDSYQQLAELLIGEGLLEQAVQVLNLYRDQEFFDFTRDPNAYVEKVYLSTSETNFARRYEAESKKLRNLEPQIADLRRQAVNRPSGAPETRNLSKLQAEFNTTAEAFAAVLKDAANKLHQSAEDEDKDKRVNDVTKLRQSLGLLGTAPRQKAVSLYTLAADETFYVLLMTPDGVKAFSHPIKANAVNDHVKNFLAVLNCPKFDPFREASALYNIMFRSTWTKDKQATLEAELEKYEPDLLLWSLGDPFDIIPMSALYDARRKQFLVEKYQHAVFTRARPDRISREPKSWINGIGFGAAKEYSGYGPPLRGVRKSLAIIFDDRLTGQKGIINGPALIDEQFTRSELANLNGKWPLVHIASHFDHHPGDSYNSALLLGDGQKFSLAEMQQHQTLFLGVELLMLSACKTSVRGSNSYGKEIEGFAELAQRLGANSVVATLWNVYDPATPEREFAFYSLYRDHQDWAKSELLRQSQLNLLHGRVAPEARNKPSRTASVEGNEEKEGCVGPGRPRKGFTPDPKAPLAHPYYWAPFVLYGSSR